MISNNQIGLVYTILLCIYFSSDLKAQCPNGLDANNLFGQAEVDNFLLNNPDCTFIEELELNGDVTDLSGFSTVEKIGYLYITDCPVLSSLNGFHNIDTINGNFGVEGSASLTNLIGMGNLKHIGQDLRIRETTGLVNLNGLELLNTIEDDLEIVDNTSLACLDGLDGITLVEGDIRLENNPLLSNCCAIKSIFETSGVLGDVSISGNPLDCSALVVITFDPCLDEDPLCGSGTVGVNEIENNDQLNFVNHNGENLFIVAEEFQQFKSGYLFNQLGQKVIEFDSSDNSIDISRLIPGVYIVSINVNGVLKSQKIVVQ